MLDNREELAAAPPSELTRRRQLQRYQQQLQQLATRCLTTQEMRQAAQAWCNLLRLQVPGLQLLGEALHTMQTTQRRLGVVLDLLLAADSWVDATAYTLACHCVQQHIALAHVQLQEALALLRQLPHLPKACRPIGLS